jgi:hypothetical protein
MSSALRDSITTRRDIGRAIVRPAASVCHCRAERKRSRIQRVKYWEIIADNLSKAGWSWGCLSAVDRDGRTIWIVDAHRDDGKRFIARSDEKLTAFVEVEAAIRLAAKLS